MNTPLLRVENLVKTFPGHSSLWGKGAGAIQALQGVSFELHKGETLGLVGESGCGKSTLGRCLIRLIDPTSGSVWFNGRDVSKLPGNNLRPLRRNMQMIFQDPMASLNPKMKIGEIIEEPMIVHQLLGSSSDRRDRVTQLLEMVGLRGEVRGRYPHEFSGGQRQRVGIARALAAEPELIICDEPVSNLDVSIQAQVINLMRDLQQNLGLTYLFIAHNLPVIEHVSTRVAVMYLGQIVETGSTAEVFARPQHPYTKALLSAIPSADPNRRGQQVLLRGEAPSVALPLSGCQFHPRCPMAVDQCMVVTPSFEEKRLNHWASCLQVSKL